MAPLPVSGPTYIPPAADLVPLPPPPGLMERATKFVEENQKLILVGCGVVAAAGAGYYIYSSRSAGGPGPSGSSSAPGEKPSGKNKKKKKSKKNDKFIKGEGSEGPLLEEIQPKAEEKKEEQPEDPLAGIPDEAAIAAMSESDRNALGKKLKDKGNKLYSKKDFKRAVDCYTKAIEISKEKDAVFYSNRAACYINFSPPEYDLCVKDCDEALKLDHI